MAEEISERLKLSNVERERIGWLVEKHQFLCEAQQMRVSKLKQTLAHPGIRELLALHRADALATGRSTEQVEFCEQLLSQWTEADLDSVPLLTGDGLPELGLNPTPTHKRPLGAVRDAAAE